MIKGELYDISDSDEEVVEPPKLQVIKTNSIDHGTFNNCTILIQPVYNQVEEKRKNCTKCGENKLLSEFCKDKYRSDGYCTQCKTCRKNYRDNPNNKDRMKQIREEYKPKRNKDRRNRRKIDKEYQIKENLRTRIWHALKGTDKSAQTIELLGCSIEFWKDWLEYNFYDGMSWENYGTHWSVEHVRACDTFDLTDTDQQKLCFNWKNTNCLTVRKNSSKNARRNIFAELLQELNVKVYISNYINNLP